MTKSSCEIFLNKSDGVFSSGENISGFVLITFYKKKYFTAIYLHINGDAKSEWGEQQGNYRRVYKGKERYVSSKTYFLESKNGKSKEILPGTYKYPFYCELPDNLPSSFEGNYGKIRYRATIYFERTTWPDKKYINKFTIIKQMDLNKDRSLKLSVVKEEAINFHRFLLFKSNNLLLTARIPSTGYIPGQTISITLEVDNKSNQNVHQFKIGFYKVVVYYDTSGKHNKKIKLKLAGVVLNGCPVNQTAVLRQELIVPNTIPTDITFSKIITISYQIKIIAIVDSGHFNPEMKIPITVGTTAIDNITTNYSISRKSRPASTSCLHNLAPPSYSEAIGETSTRINNWNNDLPKTTLVKL